MGKQERGNRAAFKTTTVTNSSPSGKGHGKYLTNIVERTCIKIEKSYEFDLNSFGSYEFEK